MNVIAVTDHDTTDGVAEAQQAANGSPVVIPGIELSAEENGLDVHMLGYFVRVNHPDFQAQLVAFRERRVNRAQQMVERLGELGMPISWERVMTLAGGAAIGRPHIARALVEAQHVSSMEEAFTRYLYNGGPAYVSRKRLSPEEAVELIHHAGGVAVMAHPGLVQDYEAIATRLIAAGLDGIEVMHPKNTAAVRDNLRGLAVQHGLIMTGGSDFHGHNDKFGSETPPPQCIRSLRERAARYT